MNNLIKKLIKFLIKYQLFIFFLFILIFRFFYAANVVNFTQDQARDVWKMEEFKQSGKFFIEYGPKASVGDFYLAPFYYQLQYWLSLVTGNHPLTMHWFITLIESITPVVLFLLLKDITEKKYAYIISLLYASSPIVTIFSTFAWNPNMIPFLSLTSLLFAQKHLSSNRKEHIILFSLFLTLAVHLHYQAIVLLPFYIFVFILSVLKNRKNVKYWIIGILLALMTLIPYIYAEIISNWQNTFKIFSYFTGEHSRYFDRISKPAFVLTFIPSFFERILIGQNYIFRKFILGRLIFWLGMIFLIIKSIKDKKVRIVLAYFIGILLMLRVYKGDKLDYYMSTLFTFPYFLLAMFTKKLKIFSFVLIVIIASLIGYKYQSIKPNNQLKNLQNAIMYLNENVNEEKISFHLHDDNYLNIFAYAVNRYSGFTQDKNSLMIVDVCSGLQACDWDGGLWCKHDRGYTHMVLFREKANYSPIKFYSDPEGYSLRIGAVDFIPEINYPVSTYNSEYGNDLLDEGW
jgi:4-amino-4-deoxy-L-arabinose transferase-like glycosyltransferase